MATLEGRAMSASAQAIPFAVFGEGSVDSAANGNGNSGHQEAPRHPALQVYDAMLSDRGSSFLRSSSRTAESFLRAMRFQRRFPQVQITVPEKPTLALQELKQKAIGEVPVIDRLTGAIDAELDTVYGPANDVNPLSASRDDAFSEIDAYVAQAGSHNLSASVARLEFFLRETFLRDRFPRRPRTDLAVPQQDWRALDELQLNGASLREHLLIAVTRQIDRVCGPRDEDVDGRATAAQALFPINGFAHPSDSLSASDHKQNGSGESPAKRRNKILNLISRAAELKRSGISLNYLDLCALGGEYTDFALEVAELIGFGEHFTELVEAKAHAQQTEAATRDELIRDILDGKRDWEDAARCKGHDTEKFMVTGAAQNRVKPTCNGCDVIYQCAAAAFDKDESGVWGGMTDRERNALIRQQGAQVAIRKGLDPKKLTHDELTNLGNTRRHAIAARYRDTGRSILRDRYFSTEQ